MPDDAPVPHEKEVPSRDVLQIDASYRNTSNWKRPHDQFNRFFRVGNKGLNNTSGFKPRIKDGAVGIENSAFCLLVTTFNEPEWPDELDPETGLFTYYGDNRAAGRALIETDIGGNRLLEYVFERAHSGERGVVPPFLCFESYDAGKGAHMRFLGLACPGARGVSALEDLIAVWRVKGRSRFQNYCALFTLLAEPRIERRWLEHLVAGMPPAASPLCPPAWRRWVETGEYRALMCERKREPRSRSDQMPRNPAEEQILRAVHSGLTDREFEFAAAEITRLVDSRFGSLVVTRAVRDGGRDVIGSYRVGHDQHQVLLSAIVEAKRWDPESSVGVKPMMRLISRLKHRDVGVFVTTSYFERQVQEELIEDGHPVVLVAGGDIARILVQNEIVDARDDGKLGMWLASIRRAARGE